jgi:putative hydrolase of the HAD superfamily
MKYQAVFFDLFGTLVRNFSFQDYDKVLVRMASVMSISPEDFSRLWYATARERNTGGLNTIQTGIEYIGQKMGVHLEKEQIEQAVKVRVDYVKSMILAPRPGAVETLTWLRSHNYKVGLISDCSIDIPLAWDKTPLAALFDTVVFSCDVGFRKPDPRIYELAAQRLGVKPEDCLFIGDGGSTELTGALKTGLHPVLIKPYGDTELPQSNSEARTWQGPVISSLEEVLTLVEKGHD